MPRSKSAPPTQQRSANLSPTQIREAIPRLEKRIAELEELPVTSIASTVDPRVLAQRHAIESTLAGIFGPDTHEYHRLSAASHFNSMSYAAAVQIGRHPSVKTGVIQEEIEQGGNAPLPSWNKKSLC
jgi:hypothetical protein